MNKKKSRFALPTLGGSTLLVIFAVLCLLTFALLTLSTALSNRRLSEASLSATAAYYEADCAAEEIIAALRNGDVPAEVTKSENTYSFTCPITEKQSLFVEVEDQGESWYITQYKTVTADDAAYDETITVWDGETAN
ncbi:MAG: hypothetical protein IJC58_01140 [Oscillospiraceae bacterium]|nr:hypothetical protein [Oscillospiraceae bacterium]